MIGSYGYYMKRIPLSASPIYLFTMFLVALSLWKRMQRRKNRVMNKDNGNEIKPAFGLIDIGTITSLLIPLLYTTGWSFAYNYFKNFQLGLIGLDIPKEYLFLYSFWVIKDQWLLSLVAILFFVVTYMLVRLRFNLMTPRNYKNKPYLLESFVLFLAPVAILILFVLFYHMGDRTAQAKYKREADSDFSSYPRVKIWLNKKSVDETGKIENMWSNECYRLLLRNKDNLYVFYSDSRNEKNLTYIIPQNHVRIVRVLPLYNSPDSCD